MENMQSQAVNGRAPQQNGTALPRSDSFSAASEASQTAQEFIASQLQLEAEAREVFPYQFSTCTKPLGPLRQGLFSCLTCNPPPADPAAPYKPAGVCYSCSISCHGEHELVELFQKRNFECDCGTTRLPNTSPCTLRIGEETGTKGNVHSEKPAATNKYNQNFRNRFCGCGQVYDAQTEKGVMFQCLGLGTVEDGGCGEDWWHADCIMGLERDHSHHLNGHTAAKPEPGTKDDVQKVEATENDPQTNNDEAVASDQEEEDEESDLPEGFPDEDAFEHFICYKCTEAFPWIKQYAGTPGFLPGLPRNPADRAQPDHSTEPQAPLPSKTEHPSTDATVSLKRKADDDNENSDHPSPKRSKPASPPPPASAQPHHTTLPAAAPHPISLFLTPTFRATLCRCPTCFPRLPAHPHLLEAEEPYAPPVSDSGSENGAPGGSVGSRSLLDRGEAALGAVDRVRAIEGVMAYNHLRDKVKAFLAPFAESGRVVGAEDVKEYFARLRGDEAVVRGEEGAAAEGGVEGDGRREQGGY